MTNEPRLTKEQEQQLIEILSCPIKFAENMLKMDDKPVELRWYQKEVLNKIMANDYASNRIVLRWGRRLGKCVPGHAEIMDPETGELLTAEELYDRGRATVPTLANDYEIKPNSEVSIMKNGIKEVFKVTTKTGREVYATGNHPLLTINGWKEIDDLKPGDRVAIPNNMPYFGNKEINPESVKLLAYIIGDGGTTSNSIRFSNNDERVLEEVSSCSNHLGVSMKHINGCDYKLTNGRKNSNNNAVTLLMKENEVYNKSSFEKRIPKSIFTAPKEQVALFLNRLFACDGWAGAYKSINRGKKSPEIGYCSVSKKLIHDIQHLLLRFGIMSNICKKKTTKPHGAYQLVIHRSDSIEKFANEINIFSKERGVEEAAKYAKQKQVNGNQDTLPIEIWEEIEEDRLSKELTKTEVATGVKSPSRNSDRKLRMQYAPSKDKVKRYANNLDNDDLYKLADSDIYWDTITSIEFVGEEQTYDLSVNETENFVVNDVITHNTTVISLFMIWQCFTQKNAKMVVVAPYDKHVNVLFKMTREFIQSSPDIDASIERDTKNPQYIEFRNGSTIQGFTSGVKSGDKGDSVRGQEADWIFLDEADRLRPDDIDSVVAIAAEDSENIGILASSTPTGKREKFYEWCNSPNWTEFHFPSTVNPNWTEQSEREFRDMLSAQGYVHEILAEFGEETEGVFAKRFIDMAKEDYQYEEKASEWDTVCIGVDWDKYTDAPQIVIVKFDRNFVDKFGNSGPKFRVIKREEIEQSEFTFDNAVKKIIEMNKKYKPDFIYCDRGHGEYQIETLRKIGLEKPETGLYQKVKGISFGSKIEVRDPATKEMEKKPIKPFMVNQTAIILERGQLVLNENDQDLWKQLEDYRVVRKTKSGEPVYTDENEHALDAMMLAILGFSLEYPNLTKILQQFHVARKMGKAPRMDKLLGDYGKVGDSLSRDSKKKEEDMFDPEDPEEQRGLILRKGKVKDPTKMKKNKGSKSFGRWGERMRGARKPPKRRW